ncbi:alpha/beta fold hydrolase [Ornithinibacillus contaminans]|uniref:alpha/beta fold hydrolase n=1 Tax=Ornithinibacillus contaminans TaxID=694055 RepID=UPI00069E6B46|nr:alpha/beta hydrolase [Ornithinibacillus contaminans]
MILIHMNYTKTYLNIMNTSIYCEHALQKEKPPLFLLHGFVASSYTFNRLKPLLAKNFSVIAIDLPGFGKSEKSTTFTYSFDQYANLVLACFDYFQLKRVAIGGHSMGGQIALYTAKKAPDRVTKLLLFASSGYLPGAKPYLIYSSYLPFFHLLAKRKINAESVVKNLRNVFYDHSLITADQIEEYGKPLQDKNFPKSLIRLLRHREGDLTSKELQTIKTPALLLWGVADKVVPLSIGKRLAADLPHATLISYDKTGHLITEEKPEALYQQILAFLTEEAGT